MKYNFFTQRHLFVTLCAMVLVFTGCIKEDMDDCKYYTVQLKVENQNGGDITESGIVSEATLFVFDANNKYLDKVLVNAETIKNRRYIELDYPSSSQLNVVAWGGLSGQNQDVTEAQIISDLQVNLQKQGNIANSPDSLYHGTKTVITRASEGQTIHQEIVIRKKVGSVQVRTIGIEYVNAPVSKAGESVNPNDFTYIVDKTPSGFDYQGLTIGDSVSYSPEPIIAETTGYLETEKSNVIPSDKIGVSLQGNGVEIYNRDVDDDGKPFKVEAGDDLLIVVRLGEDGNVVSVKSYVRKWGESGQEEEL